MTIAIIVIVAILVLAVFYYIAKRNSIIASRNRAVDRVDPAHLLVAEVVAFAVTPHDFGPFPRFLLGSHL